MNNKRMQSIFTVIIAGFLLYLCPCASAVPTSEVSITEAMNRDCCERMPNCPIQSRSAFGIQSLISSFNVENHTLDLAAHKVLTNKVSFFHGNGISLPSSLLPEDTRLATPTSPKLYIRYASLLI